jgi:chromosome segregation ATPase
MDYTGSGDLRQRMVALLTEAKSQGQQLQDIIPERLQDDFYGVKELCQAKEFIKEGEEREKILQSELETVKKQLAVSKKSVEDLPEDYNQLQIECGQLKGRVEFYLKLKDDAETEARTMNQKLLVALEKQVATDAKDAKIQELEELCARQTAINFELTQETRRTGSLFETLTANHMLALEKKEAKIMDLERIIKKVQQYSVMIEKESEGFEAEYTGLVARLEKVNGDCATALHDALKDTRALGQINAAAVSEAHILRKFYDHANNVLLIYQKIFQQLLNNNQQIIRLPDSLQKTLDKAHRECEAFAIIHGALKIEGILDDRVLEELFGLSVSANKMQQSLQAIAGDVSKFVMALRHKPDLLLAIRMKFRLGIFGLR